MFGLGFWEIAMIVLAAFVFIRPDDLPAFLRNVEKLYKGLMELYRDLTSMAKGVDSELRHPLSLPESDEPAEQEPEKNRLRPRTEIKRRKNHRVKNRTSLLHFPVYPSQSFFLPR